ncbi:hypothetical protein [Oerskovia sp. KBS0722]|uniref:hypothetical protein n=1 Tax=Oerskovia sp. KBS0722 TaxID=1179673 RepID=UPI00143CC6B1|nr:hypothetical protein [Oerskovia sp. KBS0722]
MRAHLLDDLGRPGEAAVAFRSAAARTQNTVEQDYLLDRARTSAAREPGTR